MKRLLAAITFCTLVFGGFFFMDQPVDTAQELEPPVLGNSSVNVM